MATTTKSHHLAVERGAHCPVCDVRVDVGGRRCIQCGASLDNPDIVTGGAAASRLTKTEASKRGVTRRRPHLALAILVAAAFAVACSRPADADDGTQAQAVAVRAWQALAAQDQSQYGALFEPGRPVPTAGAQLLGCHEKTSGA